MPRKFTLRIDIDMEKKVPVEKLGKQKLNRRHTKPTLPYGYQQVNDDGTVTPIVAYLADTKEEQEAELIDKFAEVFNKKDLGNISDIRQRTPPEPDFLAKHDGQEIAIELTEVSLRGIGYRVGDGYYVPNLMDAASLIPGAIQRKLDNNYQVANEKRFWLVIYQLDSGIGSEEGAEYAQSWLKTLTQPPFDAVYYFHLNSPLPDGVIRTVYTRQI